MILYIKAANAERWINKYEGTKDECIGYLRGWSDALELDNPATAVIVDVGMIVWPEPGGLFAGQIVANNRCICVGSDSWCSHSGRCRGLICKPISDHYCDACLANAKAESSRQ